MPAFTLCPPPRLHGKDWGLKCSIYYFRVSTPTAVPPPPPPHTSPPTLTPKHVHCCVSQTKRCVLYCCSVVLHQTYPPPLSVTTVSIPPQPHPREHSPVEAPPPHLPVISLQWFLWSQGSSSCGGCSGKGGGSCFSRLALPLVPVCFRLQPPFCLVYCEVRGNQAHRACEGRALGVPRDVHSAEWGFSVPQSSTSQLRTMNTLHKTRLTIFTRAIP